MEINSNSQMSLLNRISQTVIDDIDDFSIEEESNKIKVKPDSLENILNHWNIPMSRSAVVNNTNEISNENLYTIIDRNLDIIEDGAKKPINVKPAMFENIIGKSFDVQPSKIVDNVFSNEKSTGSDLDEGFITVDDDINELMSQLDGYKDTLFQKMDKVKKMKEELEKSDMEVQDISVQFTEAEKKLKEAEIRNMELKKQIISKLNDQKEFLSSKLISVENMETKINEKKESNNAQIIDFNKRIDSIIERTNGLNQEASKKEEMLNSIDGKYTILENDDLEGPIRKIA